jgi:hypothetical protein
MLSAETVESNTHENTYNPNENIDLWFDKVLTEETEDMHKISSDPSCEQIQNVETMKNERESELQESSISWYGKGIQAEGVEQSNM